MNRLTPEEAAAQIGLHPRTYYRLEKGETACDIKTLWKVLGWLVGDGDKPAKRKETRQ